MRCNWRHASRSYGVDRLCSSVIWRSTSEASVPPGLLLRLPTRPGTGDGSQQQLAAEMRGCVGFVESAPLLAQLAELKLREARDRLPASRDIAKRAAHACSGAAMR